MPNLETTYMNLKLKNPIIVASSGLTKSIDRLKVCEEQGAGAVVLKSIFEEVISKEDFGLSELTDYHTEVYDYIRSNLEMQYGPKDYCDLIEKSKKELSIPVIASINCVSDQWWPRYAVQIQESGADALELNIYSTPIDPGKTGSEIEKIYIEIVEAVRQKIQIPIAVKITNQITSLPNLVKQLSDKGADAVVMFNRFTEPDIDIKTLDLKTTFHFSTANEMYNSLKWISILSGKTDCDLAATTGIHTFESIIKMLLAGASAVEIASVLYKNGVEKISLFIKEIENWMQSNNFNTIEQFKGMASLQKTEKTDHFLRAQFIDKIRGYE